MQVVSQRILRISLLISSILFFNYMFRLISSTSKVDMSSIFNVANTSVTSIPIPITTQEQLQGKEHFHKWLSLVYIAVLVFKYKTFNEQLGLYIVFFIIMNVAYYPFNCVCKDPAGWVCKTDTAPSDPRCQKIINEIKEVDDRLNVDIAEIKASKTRVFDAMTNNMFPTFEVPYIEKLNDDAFNIPQLQSMRRLVPHVKFSCPVPNLGDEAKEFLGRGTKAVAGFVRR